MLAWLDRTGWLLRHYPVPSVRWVKGIVTLSFYIARFLWFVIRALVGRP